MAAVKELMWESPRAKHYVASAPFGGRYIISYHQEISNSFLLETHGYSGFLRYFQTLEEAKACAQEHFVKEMTPYIE